MITYIEINYVGKGVEVVPRFPISSWNMHQRVLLGFPRTSNKLERFNKEFNKIVIIKLGEKKPQNNNYFK
jgi:hypothetical protein